jgi:hypothetical protein
MLVEDRARSRIDSRGHHEVKTRMDEDKELSAMQVISRALADLDDSERGRVLMWAASRFAVSLPKLAGGKPGSADDGGDEGGGRGGEFAEFVDLYDAANPRTDVERAAVAAYWFQVVQGAPSFQSQGLNDALKNLGYPIKNITDALASLQSRRPAQVRQVAKSGSSRQARKTYKLTVAGENNVRAMLGRAARPNGDE